MLSLESGCKDKAMIPPFPNFFTVFFHLFPFNARNHMNSKTLHRKVFFSRDLPGPREKREVTGKPRPRRGKNRRELEPGKGNNRGKRPSKRTRGPNTPLSRTPTNPFDSALSTVLYGYSTGKYRKFNKTRQSRGMQQLLFPKINLPWYCLNENAFPLHGNIK